MKSGLKKPRIAAAVLLVSSAAVSTIGLKSAFDLVKNAIEMWQHVKTPITTR